MPNNTRGSRPGRPVPDDMEDDRLEEGATRPEIPSLPPTPIPDVSPVLSKWTKTSMNSFTITPNHFSVC
jgi:hypothetical protein